MKIVGLLLVKNEEDILQEMLDHASTWLDGVVAIDNGSSDSSYKILVSHPLVLRAEQDFSPFNEANFVPRLIKLAEPLKADWFVENDADEFFPKVFRDVIEAFRSFNTVSLEIHTELNGRVYNVKKRWNRAFKNDPSLFDYSILKKLHGGKNPIPKDKRITLETDFKVKHLSIRSYEQGMRKYENYVSTDIDGIQKSYEHIKQLAECLKTGDFTGVQWVS